MTKKFFLSLFIGNFSEKVLCGIVDMDAYHILLRIPWLFEKKRFPLWKEEYICFFETWKMVHIGSNGVTSRSGALTKLIL
jgi:hypothetical protein